MNRTKAHYLNIVTFTDAAGNTHNAGQGYIVRNSMYVVWNGQKGGVWYPIHLFTLIRTFDAVQTNIYRLDLPHKP